MEVHLSPPAHDVSTKGRRRSSTKKGTNAVSIRRRPLPRIPSSKCTDNALKEHFGEDHRFYSRKELLSADFSMQFDPFLEHLQDKEDFLQIFLELFLGNERVDLTAYKSDQFVPFGDKRFFVEVENINLKNLSPVRVVAVDGGLGHEKFLGSEFTLVKTAGVVYDIDSSGSKVTPFPDPSQNRCYRHYLEYGQDLQEGGRELATMRMQLAEVSLLVDFLSNCKKTPQYAILDGGVLPPPCPYSRSISSKIKNIHEQLLDYYKTLYRICNRKKISLVGSVKDSSSNCLLSTFVRVLPYLISKNKSLRKFHELRYRTLFGGFSDVEFAYKVLPLNFRTSMFDFNPLHSSDYRCGAEIENGVSPPLSNPYNYLGSDRELGSLNFFATYVKLSPHDFPLRLEFLSNISIERCAANLSQKLEPLLALSKVNPSCTIPIPQIQAHLRAKLSPREFELFLADLKRRFSKFQLKKLGKSNGQRGNKSDCKVDDSKVDGTDKNGDKSKILLNTFNSTFFARRHSRLDDIFK